MLPNSLAINCTSNPSGCRQDLEILQCNKNFHLLALKKQEGFSDIDDDGGEEEQFNQM